MSLKALLPYRYQPAFITPFYYLENKEFKIEPFYTKLKQISDKDCPVEWKLGLDRKNVTWLKRIANHNSHHS
ncbi:hypothetical protein WD019_17305 [Fictibacillus sp. Mic-4]|uniref:hypothetical protein n=1 Tax=Fictibacillus sp. Mic-4 TaxID=3132826 RepID=UPI003CEAD4B8